MHLHVVSITAKLVPKSLPEYSLGSHCSSSYINHSIVLSYHLIEWCSLYDEPSCWELLQYGNWHYRIERSCHVLRQQAGGLFHPQRCESSQSNSSSRSRMAMSPKASACLPAWAMWDMLVFLFGCQWGLRLNLFFECSHAVGKLNVRSIFSKAHCKSVAFCALYCSLSLIFSTWNKMMVFAASNLYLISIIAVTFYGLQLRSQHVYMWLHSFSVMT